MPDKIHEEQNQNRKLPSKRVCYAIGVFMLITVCFLSWNKWEREGKKNEPQKMPEPDRAIIGSEMGMESLVMGMQTDRDKRMQKPQIVKTPEIVMPDNKAVQIYVNPRQRRQEIRVPDEEMIRLGAQLRNTKVQALQAPSNVGGFVEQNKQQTGGAEQQLQNSLSSLNSLTAGLQTAGGGGMGIMPPNSAPDSNGQSDKQNFLYSKAAGLTPDGYSQNIPVPQQFPLELKAGTFIPGIMISGLNSDLPGSVIGQVSEHVYDTARGQHVLIPKGSRLIGVYSSNVTYGQSRVLVVWNRIIFPNGTSLNISGSQGMDRAGYSGMGGIVDSHLGKVISTALFASLFIAGAEMLNPKEQNQTNSATKSPSQAMSEAVANSILEAGGRMMEKAMNIQPTIKIRPGTRFNIFVAQDVVFPNAW